jgi:hypothetical protein
MMTMEQPKRTLKITVNDNEFLLDEHLCHALVKDLRKIYYHIGTSEIFKWIADAIFTESGV